MVNKKYNYIIGIDPAFRKDGFGVCVADYAKKELHFKKYASVVEFWTGKLPFYEFAPHILMPIDGIFIIENSNLQNESFDLTGSAGVIARKARNVGTNQAISQIVVDFLTFYLTEKHILGISPEQKGMKWNKAQFAQIVKSEKWTIVGKELSKISQDEIDAAKIAICGHQYIAMYHQK